MSYKSHLKTELELINETEQMYNSVCILLDTVEGQGHSYGSISILQNAIDYWTRDVFPIEEPASMLRPMWLALQNIPQDQWPKVLEYFNKTIQYLPLSPLTGEDDEWFHHDFGEGEPSNYQNKRDGKVFKPSKDGVATRLDQIKWHYPHPDYVGWWISSRKAPISFPFDYDAPENQPVQRYFRDESYTDELPVGIDPNVWLTWQRRSYTRGLTPMTVINPDIMFVYGQDHVESVCRSLVSMLCYLRFNPDANRTNLANDLRWLGEGDTDANQFTLEWVDTTNVEADHPVAWMEHLEDPWKARVLARLLTLLPEDADILIGSGENSGPLFRHEGVEYTLNWEMVVVPTKHYQDWDYTARNGFVATFAPMTQARALFFYDQNQQINGDEEAYLMDMRRKHGYAHPRKRARTLSIELDESCKDPIAAVAAVQQDIARIHRIDTSKIHAPTPWPEEKPTDADQPKDNSTPES